MQTRVYSGAKAMSRTWRDAGFEYRAGVGLQSGKQQGGTVGLLVRIATKRALMRRVMESDLVVDYQKSCTRADIRHDEGQYQETGLNGKSGWIKF